MSSSDPNLQNIPIRTVARTRDPRRVRRDPGNVLISRTTRRLSCGSWRTSGDDALVEAFTKGRDITIRTSLKVFGEHSGLS